MPLGMSIASYLTLWWVVLFAVLPWGAQSYHDAGIKVTDGGDPGAPVRPQLLRKFLVTTAVTTVVFALLWCTVYFHWVSLPQIPD